MKPRFKSRGCLCFVIRCWVSTEEYVGAKWRLNEDIKLSFDREGIEIPYQKLDVCIKSDETEQNPEIKG